MNVTDNVLNLRRGEFIVPLKQISIVDINGTIYKGVVALCRTISTEDFLRILSLNLENSSVHISVQESIIDKYLVNFTGVDKKDVDWERSDAGLVDTLFKSIFAKTKAISLDPRKTIEEFRNYVTGLEVICAAVSTRLNIDYTKTIQLPIHDVLHMASVISTVDSVELDMNKDQE